MLGLQILVIAFCGAVIGLALLILCKSLRKMARGRCCEGCAGCAHAQGCSSRDPSVNGLESKENQSDDRWMKGDIGNGE